MRETKRRRSLDTTLPRLKECSRLWMWRRQDIMIASANERRPSKNIYQDDKKYCFHGKFPLTVSIGRLSRFKFILPSCNEFSIFIFWHARKELQKYDQWFTGSRHKVAMQALFSSISASAADNDTVTPQVWARVDRDNLVQVSYASSVLKALFLIPRFQLEGECRNRHQHNQRWLMILICCIG